MKKEYTEVWRKAFPQRLHVDLNSVLRILPLENNSVTLSNGNLFLVDNLIGEKNNKIEFGGESLVIPCRIYFNEPEPDLENSLTDLQKIILNCIYLFHHDGYVRAKRLSRIADNSKEWIIPYIIQLVGEYVYELLPLLNKKINKNTLTYYAEFIAKNPAYWQQLESRMISYWNEYYRCKFPKPEEYIGFEIVNRIKNYKV